MLHNGLLSVTQRVHDAIVHMPLLGEDLDLLRGLLEWLHYLFVGFLLVKLLFLLHSIFLTSITELVL
jgi:hypothetical protein